MSKENILFNSSFEITGDVRDKDGKKHFDRVSRIEAKSQDFSMQLVLDINSEIYPLEKGQVISLMLAAHLSLDGVDKKDVWRDVGTKKSLADDFDYVMHGKVFKCEEASNSEIMVLISYGGLLMSLQGEARHLANIALGQYVYLLIRRIA